MTNIVPMRKRKSEYLGIANAETAMNVIRLAMYPYDAHTMARRCDVSVSCIYAIRSGRTKWPRHATFFMLLHVLDLEMLIVHKGAT